MENKSRLKEVRISGYKSLGTDTHPIKIELRNLNIIIGANGAGKSNFISFFQMLANMMTGALQIYIGKNGSSESLLQFGSKKTRTIALATLFLQPPELMPQVIFVDEPESGLHPQAVDVLASMVQIATEYTQVIMATQSPRLLDSFDYRDVIVAEKDEETGCTILKRLDEADISNYYV